MSPPCGACDSERWQPVFSLREVYREQPHFLLVSQNTDRKVPPRNGLVVAAELGLGVGLGVGSGSGLGLAWVCGSGFCACSEMRSEGAGTVSF
jgi:hypothetical protein